MRFLNDNDTFFVQGASKAFYAVRKIAGVIDCSCPAWRNMGGNIDSRVCKHIRAHVDPACWPAAALAREGLAPVAPTGASVPAQVAAPKVAPVAKPQEVSVMLAHSWEGQDPSGWWMSEKLDGVRALWTGFRLVTRLGNEIHAPVWFTDALPPFALDGELFMGRGRFQDCVSAVRTLVPDEAEWRQVTFVVFDAPKAAGGFEARIARAREARASYPASYPWKVLPQVRCQSREHLDLYLADVQANGGEGVMLREHGSAYEGRRSHSLLKVKTFRDDEARVVGYEAGRGKHKGRLGALVCRTKTGVEFKIGTGLSDREREAPPAVGSLVTYSYQELTRDGVPRFPAFVAVRNYE